MAKEPVAVQVRAAAWAWAEAQEPVAEQAQRAWALGPGCRLAAVQAAPALLLVEVLRVAACSAQELASASRQQR